MKTFPLIITLFVLKIVNCDSVKHHSDPLATLDSITSIKNSATLLTELGKITNFASKHSGLAKIMKKYADGQEAPIARVAGGAYIKVGSYHPIVKNEVITQLGRVIFFGDDSAYNINSNSVSVF